MADLRWIEQRTGCHCGLCQKELNTILDAFVASGDGPSDEALALWTWRYPDFKQELIAFAEAWRLMDSAPPALNAEGISTAELTRQGMEIVRRMLSEGPDGSQK